MVRLTKGIFVDERSVVAVRSLQPVDNNTWRVVVDYRTGDGVNSIVIVAASEAAMLTLAEQIGIEIKDTLDIGSGVG